MTMWLAHIFEKCFEVLPTLTDNCQENSRRRYFFYRACSLPVSEREMREKIERVIPRTDPRFDDLLRMSLDSLRYQKSLLDRIDDSEFSDMLIMIEENMEIARKAGGDAAVGRYIDHICESFKAITKGNADADQELRDTLEQLRTLNNEHRND